jgi:hypothetical protein
MKDVVLHLPGGCVSHWRNHSIDDAIARVVGWGVVAARTGPDRVGSRARRSGAAAAGDVGAAAGCDGGATGAAAIGDRGESPGANFPAGSEVSLVFLFCFRALLALGRVLHQDLPEESARLGGDDEPILVGVEPVEHRLGARELIAADLAITVLVHRA